jgi:polynuc_phos: polyribonucleotide nucleotidyltransferase
LYWRIFRDWKISSAIWTLR